MSPLLEHWLGVAYQARVLGRGDLAETKRLVRERLAADSALAAEARARLDEITDDVAQRCFISKIHREILSAVLPPAS